MKEYNSSLLVWFMVTALMFAFGIMAGGIVQDMQAAYEAKHDPYHATCTSDSSSNLTAELDRRSGYLVIKGKGSTDFCYGWLTLSPEDKELVKVLVFESGITEVEAWGLSMPMGLVSLEKVIFEGDIDHIGYGTFSRCQRLTSVEFCGDCAKIDELAFEDCVSLVGINYPTSCDVAENAFKGTPLEAKMNAKKDGLASLPAQP